MNIEYIIPLYNVIKKSVFNIQLLMDGIKTDFHFYHILHLPDTHKLYNNYCELAKNFQLELF